MHLLDSARSHIEMHYRRPQTQRLLRGALLGILPYPKRLRLAMALARPFRVLAPAIEAVPGLRPCGALLAQVPRRLPDPARVVEPGTFPAKAEQKMRVLIPSGCVQQVLEPEINRAAIRLLTTLGIEVTLPDNDGCCGALTMHLGRADGAKAHARANIDAWMPKIEQGLDGIIITTSGCGTTIKDYGHLLADDPEYAEKAARVSALTKDVTEFLADLDLPDPVVKPGIKVAYQSACSLMHAQKVMNQPRKLLLKAGFKLARPKDEHLCCGSAGTYSILQPDI